MLTSDCKRSKRHSINEPGSIAEGHILQLNRRRLQMRAGDKRLKSVIASYEKASCIQMAVPDVDGQVGFLRILHLTRNQHGRPVFEGGVLVQRVSRRMFNICLWACNCSRKSVKHETCQKWTVF